MKRTFIATLSRLKHPAPTDNAPFPAIRWSLMRQEQEKERGFSLVEMMIAVAILGIISIGLAQLLMVQARQQVRAAARMQLLRAEQDMRRLYSSVTAVHMASGVAPYQSAGPWPVQVPRRTPVKWDRPAPGFEEYSWAPSVSPTLLQFRVDGWATGFNISAIGDLDRDGNLELYRIWGDVGMFEGPLPFPSPPVP